MAKQINVFTAPNRFKTINGQSIIGTGNIEIQGGGGGGITIDPALDPTSTNPVQNKVVTAALNDKQDSIETFTFTSQEFSTLTGGSTITLLSSDPRYALVNNDVLKFVVSGITWEIIANRQVNHNGVIGYFVVDYNSNSDLIIDYFVAFIPGVNQYTIQIIQKQETGVSILTTAPISDNAAGKFDVVLLDAEPAHKYNGYLYVIDTGSEPAYIEDHTIVLGTEDTISNNTIEFGADVVIQNHTIILS